MMDNPGLLIFSEVINMCGIEGFKFAAFSEREQGGSQTAAKFQSQVGAWEVILPISLSAGRTNPDP